MKKNNRITIIMYHYVRDLPKTPYPKIKGLLIEKFEKQLDYIAKYYTVCSLEETISAVLGETTLPQNPCFLTFDDGLIDHYITVFPRLKERGMTGVFFPSAKSIEEHIVLDAHKIHFILATVTDYKALTKEIFALLKPLRKKYKIPPDEELYKRYAIGNRYDPPPVVFIKRVLQKGLPEKVRLSVLSTSFAKYVTDDEKTFAKGLYINITQLRRMKKEGMGIGGHGYAHVFMDTLSESGQKKSIKRTLDFLTKIYGFKPSNWAMAYPYSTYNSITINILKKFGCVIGLTAQPGIANLSTPLELKRVDTIYFP